MRRHVRTHTHTHTHNRYKSSERVISLSQGPQPTQQTTNITNTHAPSGIRTGNPRNRAVEDLRLYFILLSCEVLHTNVGRNFLYNFHFRRFRKEQSEVFHPEFSHKFRRDCRHPLDSQKIREADSMALL